MRLIAIAAVVTFVFSLLFVASAQARCDDNGSCRNARHHAQVNWHHSQSKKHAHQRRGNRAHHHAANNKVAAMIARMAPSYGVPAWFALRIAKVESGFKPWVRGRAGEYGVFQLKCRTARGLGFRGPCSGLLDARTNVTYGLKHLSLAVRSSRGNLKLAASKHNGGLGRKRIVRHYVALVF